MSGKKREHQSRHAQARSPRHAWLFVLLLFVATIIAYTPAWNGKPLWDDDAHITRPDLRSLDGLGLIWFRPGATQQYYPLVHSVFWIEHKIWADATLGYHFTNILLHACAALLLVKILQRLQIPGAWLAGAIFALHPVQVESVAWIAELKNTLSGLCYLGAALVYLEFDRSRKRNLYIIALVLFIFGLASKTVVATLPAALLLVFWWKHEKLTWKCDLAPLLPFFVIGIAAGIFTASIESGFIGGHNPEFHFSWVDRFLIAGRAFWFYLGKLFWPANLVFIYPRWNVDRAVWWQYLFPAAALLLLVILVVVRRRGRGPLVAMLYFGGTLLPALGFFDVYPFRYSFVADHFQYLASIGPIVLVTTGLSAAFDWLEGRKLPVRQIVSAALLLLLGALTWRQCAQYVDLETLWRTTLAKNPDAWLAHNNLGNSLLQAGRIDEAVSHFQRAVEINPNSPEAHNNLGNRLRQMGRTSESLAQLEKAVEIDPKYAEGHNNLGNTLLAMGRAQDAIAHFNRALEIDPVYAEAHNNLGNALLTTGRTQDAVAHFDRALQINPTYAAAHYNLGNAFLQSGKLNDAVAHFEKALEIDPNDIRAHNNLGAVYLQLGKVDQAIAHLDRAIAIDPNNGQAHNNAGNAFLRTGKIDDAISHYNKALEVDPRNINAANNLAWLLATSPDARIRNGVKAVELAERADELTGHDNAIIIATLAAAYAEAGRFPDAVKAAQRALPLATVAENAALAEAVRAQIKLYESKSPSREGSPSR
jgi:tetratricopeptide (TPR) repeat protein